MSKECPSCHEEVDEVYQCVDCGRMFCFMCGGKVLYLEPILPPRCPDCTGLFMGRGEKVSRDDDDDTPIDEESSSSDYEETDSGSSYSSSSYSETSSGGTSSEPYGEIIVVAVIVIIALAIGGALSNRQSTPVNTEVPHTYNPPPPVAPTQTRDTYFFENTLPGTYNMGRGQGHEVEQKQADTTDTTEDSPDTITPEDLRDQRIVGTWNCEQVIDEISFRGQTIGITTVHKVGVNQYEGQFEGTATSFPRPGAMWADTMTAEIRSRSVVFSGTYSFVDDNTVAVTGTTPTNTTNGITIANIGRSSLLKFSADTLRNSEPTPTGGFMSSTCTKLPGELPDASAASE